MRIPDKFYNEPLDDEKTEFLTRLREKGTLALLYRYGIITETIIKSLEARIKVRDLMLQGKTKGQAVIYVADMMNVHPKHLYTYLR